VTAKKKGTYRFTPELETKIAEMSAALGISKNAFVQIKLAEVLKIDKPRKAG
jgi:predicted HicB family RNase H-like nuclease